MLHENNLYVNYKSLESWNLGILAILVQHGKIWSFSRLVKNNFSFSFNSLQLTTSQLWIEVRGFWFFAGVFKYVFGYIFIFLNCNWTSKIQIFAVLFGCLATYIGVWDLFYFFSRKVHRKLTLVSLFCYCF